MRHGEYRLIVRAHRRLPFLEGDVGARRRDRERGKGDDNEKQPFDIGRPYFFMPE